MCAAMEAPSLYTRQNSSPQSLHSRYKTRHHSHKHSKDHDTCDSPIYIANPMSHHTPNSKRSSQPPLPHPTGTGHVYLPSSPMSFQRVHSSSRPGSGCGNQSGRDKRWYSSGSDQSSVGSVVGRPALGGGGIGLSGALSLVEQPSTRSSYTCETKSHSRGSAEEEDYVALCALCQSQADDLEALTTLLHERELVRTAADAAEPRWAAVDGFLSEMDALLHEQEAGGARRRAACTNSRSGANVSAAARAPPSHEERMSKMDVIRVAVQRQRVRCDGLQRELTRAQSELHRTQSELAQWKQQKQQQQQQQSLQPHASASLAYESMTISSATTPCRDFILVSALGESAEAAMRAERADASRQREEAEREARRIKAELAQCWHLLQQREEQVRVQQAQLAELHRPVAPGCSSFSSSSPYSSASNVALSARSHSDEGAAGGTHPHKAHLKHSHHDAHAPHEDKQSGAECTDSSQSNSHDTAAANVASASAFSSAAALEQRRRRRTGHSSRTASASPRQTSTCAVRSPARTMRITTRHRRILAGSDYVALLCHAPDVAEEALRLDLSHALHVSRSAVRVTDMRAASRYAVGIQVELQHEREDEAETDKSERSNDAVETAVLSAALPTLRACATCLMRGRMTASASTNTDAQTCEKVEASSGRVHCPFSATTMANTTFTKNVAEETESRECAVGHVKANDTTNTATAAISCAACAALSARVRECEARAQSREAAVQRTLDTAVETITTLYAALQRATAQAETQADASHGGHAKESKEQEPQQEQQRGKDVQQKGEEVSQKSTRSSSVDGVHDSTGGRTSRDGAVSALTAQLHVLTSERAALQRQVSEMETDMTEMGRLRASLQRELAAAQGKLRALQQERSRSVPKVRSVSGAHRRHASVTKTSATDETTLHHHRHVDVLNDAEHLYSNHHRHHDNSNNHYPNQATHRSDVADDVKSDTQAYGMEYRHAITTQEATNDKPKLTRTASACGPHPYGPPHTERRRYDGSFSSRRNQTHLHSPMHRTHSHRSRGGEDGTHARERERSQVASASHRVDQDEADMSFSHPVTRSDSRVRQGGVCAGEAVEKRSTGADTPADAAAAGRELEESRRRVAEGAVGLSPAARAHPTRQLTSHSVAAAAAAASSSSSSSSPHHLSATPSLGVLRRSYTTTTVASQALTRTPSAKRRLLFYS